MCKRAKQAVRMQWSVKAGCPATLTALGGAYKQSLVLNPLIGAMQAWQAGAYSAWVHDQVNIIQPGIEPKHLACRAARHGRTRLGGMAEPDWVAWQRQPGGTGGLNTAPSAVEQSAALRHPAAYKRAAVRTAEPRFIIVAVIPRPRHEDAGRLEACRDARLRQGWVFAANTAGHGRHFAARATE